MRAASDHRAGRGHLSGSLLGRLRDRLRRRGWERVREAAAWFVIERAGELYRDRVFGTYGVVVTAYPTRGGLLSGARMGVLLSTGHRALVRVPRGDLRPATEVETGAWMLMNLNIRQAEERASRR